MKIGKIEESNRFGIFDDNGKLVDDAQGYGYKNEQSASKAMWYKFNGGKEKIKESEKLKKQFFKDHIGVEKFIQDSLPY